MTSTADADTWTCAAHLGTRWPTMAARCDRWATNLEDDEGADQ